MLIIIQQLTFFDKWLFANFFCVLGRVSKTGRSACLEKSAGGGAFFLLSADIFSIIYDGKSAKKPVKTGNFTDFSEMVHFFPGISTFPSQKIGFGKSRFLCLVLGA